ISENGVRRALSPLFQVVLPLNSLPVESIPVPLRGPETISSIVDTMMFVAGGGRLAVAAWKVTNNSRRTRVLRMPGNPTGLSFRGLMELGEANLLVPRGSPPAMIYTAPWVVLDRDPSEGPTSRVIVLEPGDVATLTATVAPPGPMRCRLARMHI